MATRGRTKRGTSQAATRERKRQFADAYVANGGNQTQAAIAVGYPQDSAYQRGYELVNDSEVRALITDRQAELQRKFALRAEDVIRELARIVHFDPRKLYNEFGALKPISELDDDTAAALASVETNEISVDGVAIGSLKKVKMWDKNAAIDKAMRHLGLYEKDNGQVGKGFAEALVKARERARGRRP